MVSGVEVVWRCEGGLESLKKTPTRTSPREPRKMSEEVTGPKRARDTLSVGKEAGGLAGVTRAEVEILPTICHPWSEVVVAKVLGDVGVELQGREASEVGVASSPGNPGKEGAHSDTTMAATPSLAARFTQLVALLTPFPTSKFSNPPPPWRKNLVHSIFRTELKTFRISKPSDCCVDALVSFLWKLVQWIDQVRFLVLPTMAAAACTMCGAIALAVSSSGVEGLRPRPERIKSRRCVAVRAAGKENQGKEEEEEKKSLFTRLTDALASAAVRSDKDAALLQEACQATKLREKMSREQVCVERNHLSSRPLFYSFLPAQ
jgi:hypothetical protein